MHPQRAAGRARLQGRDPRRHPLEQLAVVADEQHRLGRLDELVLQPPLGRDVEVVVGLVEQQDLLRATQQCLEDQSLLLPAREGRDLAPLRLLEGHTERRHRADVPEGLVVVAAGVGPVHQGLCVGQLVTLGVALHHQQLGAVDLRGGPPHRLGRDGHEQVAHRRLVADLADELAHDAEAARAGDRALVRCDVAGDDPAKGGLARPVGADERDLGALAHAEADLVQQGSPVRQDETDGVDVDMAHEGPLSRTGAPVFQRVSERYAAGRPRGIPHRLRQRRAGLDRFSAGSPSTR